MPSNRIELNPGACDGKPVIKGANVSISDILKQVAKGKAWDDILRSYPGLNPEDIPAALLYASDLLDKK